jgi:hypothetical protein
MFVEVDKLGGTVRRIAGAGHGDWAPNNIFHTFAPDSIPVTLPIFGIVELGKHATAPDVNKDGVFTPGIDSNSYWDAAKVWGIRDTTGTTDSSIRAYDGSMSIPRQLEHRKGSAEIAKLFPKLGERLLGPEQQVCKVTALPKESGKKCEAPTSLCAQGQVMFHSDHRTPDAVLKPGIFPRHFLRIGMAVLPGPTPEDSEWLYANSPAMAFAYGFELNALGLPVPGRVELEVVNRGGTTGAVSARYQRLVTNLFGLYGGLTWLRDLNRSVKSLDLDFDPGLSLSGGLLFETPVPKLSPAFKSRLNVTIQPGLLLDNAFGLNWEMRVGLSVVLNSPFRRFGIRAKDSNPY